MNVFKLTPKKEDTPLLKMLEGNAALVDNTHTMGIETFPEIESFQKLPHQVIVKGGNWSFKERDGAELRGIVINNIGHAICDLRVNLVIFNEKKLPVFNISTASVPDSLPQGGIANFIFQLKDYSEKISNYHLYAHWKFDDRE
jgi:hypothetical protein